MRFLTQHDLNKLKRIPYGPRHTRCLVAEGKFPVPRKLNNKTLVWDEEEVDAWMKAQPRADEKAA